MNLYKEYDTATLATLQSIEYRMLQDFDALCTKHGIRYFAGWGTAIGAVRHHGIIPWDDDIDIQMVRADYDRFVEVAEREYGDKYYLLSARKDLRWPMMSDRWCLRGTVFEDESMAHLGLPMGIFIDIYCFEPIPSDEKKARRQWFRAWFWGKLMTLRQVPRPVLFAYGLKARLLAFACLVGHCVLRLLFTQEFLFKKADSWGRKNEGNAECTRYAFLYDAVPYQAVQDLDEIFPTKRVRFGEGEICLAKDVDGYLRRCFGDYMTLPPPDQRHNHPASRIDFGPYAPDVE